MSREWTPDKIQGQIYAKINRASEPLSSRKIILCKKIFRFYKIAYKNIDIFNKNIIC